MSTLTFSVIQTHLHWEQKAANIEMLEKKISEISVPTEIVILPEMFSTGFSMEPEKLAEDMEGTTVAWMKHMAAKKKIILTGSVIIKENDQYYNRLLWVQPDGHIGIYDKRHLFTLAGEQQHYTAGNNRFIAQVKGWKIHLQVCYDLRFPVWSRQQSATDQPEYDVLIYVANWPERRNHAWKTLLMARAIENQAFVIGVNRVGEDGNQINHTGDSMIIGPLGEIIYHRQDEEEVHTVTLQKASLEEIRSKLPFWKDADHFRIQQF